MTVLKESMTAFLSFLSGIPDQDDATLVRVNNAQPFDVRLFYSEKRLSE